MVGGAQVSGQEMTGLKDSVSQLNRVFRAETLETGKEVQQQFQKLNHF